ncbi:hypothetical protein D9M70_487500 [compost metagenome]
MAGTGQLAKRLVERTGMASVVDDAQHLFTPGDLLGQGRIFERAQCLHPYPLQLPEQPLRLGRQLAHVLQPADEIRRLQRRLGGSTEHRAAMVVERQLIEGGNAGPQQLER